MLDSRPIDEEVAAALAAADDLATFQRLLSIFGTPLATTSWGYPGNTDDLVLLTDGHQHGVLAWTQEGRPQGSIHWGTTEELLSHFFGEGHVFDWSGHEARAKAFLTGAMTRFPVEA